MSLDQRSGRNKLTPAEFQRLKESFQERLVQDADMTHAYLRVGLAISWHMNRHTGEARPGTVAIIKRARVGKNTVPRAIEFLAAKGHVVAEGRAGKVTRYYPRPLLPELSTTTPIALGDDHPHSLGGRTSNTSKEPLSSPRSLSSPEGSLARHEEEEAWRGREEETQGKKSPQDLGHQPMGGEAGSSQNVDDVPPRDQRPTLAELKANFGDNWGLRPITPGKWTH
jgi:hypothetical protein